MKTLHATSRQDQIISKYYVWNFDQDFVGKRPSFDLSYLLGFILPSNSAYQSAVIGINAYQEFLDQLDLKLSWQAPGRELVFRPIPFWYYQSISREQYHQLNSKVAWNLFLNDLKLRDGKNIFDSADEVIKHLKAQDRSWLFKSDQGFSGKGHSVLGPDGPFDQLANFAFPVVGEPLEKRVDDFSIFLSPYKKLKIFYRNMIDQRFQYKGTVIKSTLINDGNAFLESLGLSNEASQRFLTTLKLIESRLPGFVSKMAPNTVWGGSIDSFTYENGGRLQAHPGCEFNFRRTMGLVSYLLWRHAFYQPAQMMMKLESWDQLPLNVRKNESEYYQYFLDRFRQEGTFTLTPYNFRPIVTFSL
jgi:hypothetical protein